MQCLIQGPRFGEIEACGELVTAWWLTTCTLRPVLASHWAVACWCASSEVHCCRAFNRVPQGPGPMNQVTLRCRLDTFRAWDVDGPNAQRSSLLAECAQAGLTAIDLPAQFTPVTVQSWLTEDLAGCTCVKQLIDMIEVRICTALAMRALS